MLFSWYICGVKSLNAKNMDEQRLNANFLMFLQKMEKYDCYSQEMVDDIGDKIKIAPYSLNADGGGAYDGALVEIVLNRLCRMGYDLNEKAFGGEKARHPKLQANLRMLMRVLLIQHIAKAEMFIPQTDEWKRKKGWLYDFDESLKSNLKLGERSLYLAQKYGIRLTDEEYEAVRIIDREWDEKHIIMSSPLSAITRIANVLTTIELKQEHKLWQKQR